MHARAQSLLSKLPGKVSPTWPSGERFIEAMSHGSMKVELYAPVEVDPQTPHLQDELHFIHSGSGTFLFEDERYPFGPGDCFFVPAGAPHRFVEFSRDFSTWVVFWGPEGGESKAEPSS